MQLKIKLRLGCMCHCNIIRYIWALSYTPRVLIVDKIWVIFEIFENQFVNYFNSTLLASTIFSAMSSSSSSSIPHRQQTRLSDEAANWLFCNAKTLTYSDCQSQMKSRFGFVISSATVARYKAMSEYVRVKVGRKEILTPEEKACLLESVRQERAIGAVVEGNTVAATARGRVESARPGATTARGGAIHVSESWARKFIVQNTFNWRSPTTDRTVSAPQVVAGGTQLYEQLRDLQSLFQFKPCNV